MTTEEAHKVLVDNKQFFEDFERNQTLPDITEGTMQQIYFAYKAINPAFVLDSCCSSCVFNMVREADKIRKMVYHKF